MKKKDLLLIGYRAYGDWLYAVPILPYLFERYNVHLETNIKGWQLFHDDPRFIRKTCFEMHNIPVEDHYKACRSRWKKLVQEYKPHRVINLWRTLESSCIAERYQTDLFNGSLKHRREVLGINTFYDAVLKKARLQNEIDLNKQSLTGLYYSVENEAWAERWHNSHSDTFNIIVMISGSTMQKIFSNVREVVTDIINKFPKAVVYLMGDDRAESLVWTVPGRVINGCNKMPIKQAFLLTREVDYVLGGETGMLVAAGMWGTPKTMMCTTCNINQATKYQKNDYSLQSDILCSPCHKSIYVHEDCDNVGVEYIEGLQIKFPNCITGFNKEKILNIVGDLYERKISSN